ncbi:MAG: glucose-6-phosphate isomerase [Spirochaetales bacterium]|nr:glucose-6-phosphate isomerase [Spirochaetales bacterium]
MQYTVDRTSFIDPFSVNIDVDDASMPDATNRIVRRASDMRGYYVDEEALEAIVDGGDPVHYEVFERPVPEEYGHLMFCISTLRPGRVGNEFFMTKGHYHTVLETAETYLGLKGEGYMILKTPDGVCEARSISRGTMVYVPPYWAHRSVNTSTEPLVSFCVYPGDAGHNYGDIQEQGFPKRVFLEDGRVVIR